MVGIRNINISEKEFKYYKKWVEDTQNMEIQEYIAIIIKNKLEALKKQKGRCNQRSITLKKGKYKGSCTWKEESKSYKVYVRGDGINIYYGFFESLYRAEMELKHLFKTDEDELIQEAKKKQEYYKEEHRYTVKPKLTDHTGYIKAFYNKKGSIVVKFKESFINPKTNKKQTQIIFSKKLLSYFDKKGIKEIKKVCVEMDDPIEILEYREDLKNDIDNLG